VYACSSCTWQDDIPDRKKRKQGRMVAKIEKLEAENKQWREALKRACAELDGFFSCPAEVMDAPLVCKEDDCDSDGAGCWVKYFLNLVERGEDNG